MTMPVQKEFNRMAVNANTPSTARVMLSRSVDGGLEIQSTLNELETIQLLDEAMEAIDGQRLPPNGE